MLKKNNLLTMFGNDFCKLREEPINIRSGGWNGAVLTLKTNIINYGGASIYMLGYYFRANRDGRKTNTIRYEGLGRRLFILYNKFCMKTNGWLVVDRYWTVGGAYGAGVYTRFLSWYKRHGQGGAPILYFIVSKFKIITDIPSICFTQFPVCSMHRNLSQILRSEWI